MRAQTRAGSRSFGQGKKRPAVAAICMQPQRSAAQRLPMKRKTTWRRRAASGPAEASPRRPAAAPPTRRSRARPLHSSAPGWQVALSRLAAIASPADRAGQNCHGFLHPFHCTVSDPSHSSRFLRASGRLILRKKFRALFYSVRDRCSMPRPRPWRGRGQKPSRT